MSEARRADEVSRKDQAPASNSVYDTDELRADETIDGTRASEGATGPRRVAVAFERGTTVGRYVIVDRIGSGGMGVVYAAYDPELDRKIAIKILKRSVGKGRSEGHSRLVREAQALARLSHPNVVSIHDVGTHEGRVFVAMDFLSGPNLREWVEAEDRPCRERLATYLQAAEGLAAAHDAGLVHRDFKPDNVIVADGRAHVLDFGLARQATTTARLPAINPEDEELRELTHPYATIAESGSLGDALTRAGAVLGTPAYMAPEQHLGNETGPATDQFSFCVALYEGLYGECPFAGDTIPSRAFAVTQGRVRPAPRGAKVPTWMRRVILRGLSVEPDDRWPSMRALIGELQKDPSRKRRRWLAAGGLAAAAAGMFFARPEPKPICPDPEAALHGVWGATERGRLAAAFEKSGLDYAPVAAQNSAAALDAWTGEWKQSYADACAATRIRQEQSETLMDRRMHCLDTARRRASALVDRLAEGDAAAVEHAQEAIAELPSVASCDDRKALMAGVPAPTGATKTAVEAIDAKLAGLVAHRQAGEFDAALAGAAPLLAEAREVDYDPILAQVALFEAELLESVGKSREAEGAALEAMRTAALAHELRLEAEATILFGMITGDRLGRTEEGFNWLELARAHVAELDGDPALEARRLNNIALVHAAAGAAQPELDAKLAALAALESLEAPDPIQLAAVHNNLASSLAQHGRQAEAEAHAKDAIETWTRELGESHPRTAVGWATLGLVYDYGGDYAKALPAHERAVELMTAALGGSNPRLGEMLNNLAITAINLGDVQRGVDIFARVVDIKLEALGENHLEVASALGNYGSALRMLGKIEEALVVQERARAIYEKMLPEDHARIAGTLSGLANTYEELGRIDESLALRERVLKIEEKAYGPTGPGIAVDLGNLAWALIDAGELERARELAARGMGLVEAHELNPDVEAFLRLVHARVLVKLRRPSKDVVAQVDAAISVLGDLPATTERDMITKISDESGLRFPNATLPAKPDVPPDPG